MCVIIAKPAGVKMPTNKTLRRAFTNNPDGFGLAYKVVGGMPHIKKGAMTFKAMKMLLRSIPNPVDAEVILHFRLATSGHIYEGNCHPFPLSRKAEHLTALEITSRMAIAHNGIIYSSTKPTVAYYGNPDVWGDKWDALSDTQEFIRDYLVDIGDAIFNKGVRKLIEDDTMSKFAILTTKGILLIGDFTNDKGLYYSNASYKQPNYWKPVKTKGVVSTDDLPTIPETRRQGDLFLCDLCDRAVSITHLYQGCWLCDECYQDAVKTWEDGY